MKVVINNCFGGFSLSKKAVKRIADIQGRACYFFTIHYKDLLRYIPDTLEGEDGLFWSAFDIPNPNEVLHDNANWHDMTMEEKNASSALYEAHNLTERDIERNDPLLIQVVEELGEDASGRCASLKIVEIPDGTNYCIEEYDGNEHIAEQHHTWR